MPWSNDCDGACTTFPDFWPGRRAHGSTWPARSTGWPWPRQETCVPSAVLDRGFRRGFEGLGGDRKSQPEARAAVLGALDLDLAAVRFRDLADDREPEPGPGQPARGKRPVEAVEDEGQVLVVDPRPVIADRHLTVSHADLDLAARRTPLGSVVEQVADSPVEAGRHALDETGVEI